MSKRETISFIEKLDNYNVSLQLREGLVKNNVIILVGNCTVEYNGRASSQLGFGQRFVIIKEDKSVLIHRPRDYSPVNWQPPRCLFTIRVKGDHLIIKAVHRKSKERLVITFDKIHALLRLDLLDEGEFSLYASEQDMQKAILAYPSLIEEGFRPIDYEKKVKPGFIDVYGVDSQGGFVVIEIKRRIGDRAAVMQLAKYLEVLRGTHQGRVRGILVAPKISKGVQKLLASLNLEFKALDPKRCTELLDQVRREERLEDYFTSST